MGDIAAPETWGRLGEFVEKQLKQRGVPGAAVGVLYHGETVTGGFGVTNLDHPRPVASDTLFQIGSITKTFTGTALMRLVDAGKIDLQAKVRKYLPGFSVADESAAANATVWHMLTHMGGWDGDLFVDTGAGDDAVAKAVDALAGREQMAPLGAVWSYNNSGFAVAGRIMELVSGKTYETQMKELVFDPLGLQHTFLFPEDVMTHDFAVGHILSPEGPRVAGPWALPRGIGPAGRIVSDVHDMLKYARFHLGDGKGPDGSTMLSAGSMALLHTPQLWIRGKSGWAITFMVDDSAGVRQFGHGGATVGQIANLTIVPERDFAIVVLTNGDMGRLVTRDVVRCALNQYLGIEIKDPEPIPTTGAELAQYAGKYARPNGYIELGVLGGRLIAQAVQTVSFPDKSAPPPPPPPPFAMVRVGEDLLKPESGPFAHGLVEIVRKLDGSVGWVRVGLRIFKREA
jgi:CubicO group peptidase (beta-lactamase class C family)